MQHSLIPSTHPAFQFVQPLRHSAIPPVAQPQRAAVPVSFRRENARQGKASSRQFSVKSFFFLQGTYYKIINYQYVLSFRFPAVLASVTNHTLGASSSAAGAL